MTKDEIAASGEIVLEWSVFNVSVLASYEEVTEGNDTWEYLHVGCFINDMPNWGYTEAVKQNGKHVTLKAFMGGTEDDPMVYVYDEAYGLTMLDLMDGTEVWTIMKDECSICKAPLEYLESDILMECEFCHKKKTARPDVFTDISSAMNAIPRGLIPSSDTAWRRLQKIRLRKIR